MTGRLLEQPPLELAPAGRYPGSVLARQVARRAARSGAPWGLIFGFFIIVETHAYTSTYKTQAARNQLARAYGSNTAMNALLGSERAVNTVAGFADWRFVGILSLLGSIWGLLTATRLMRGEEEAGRYDLLLAGQTTRRRAAGQALAGLGAGLLALFVLTALGAIVTGRSPSAGFSLGQCLYFSVTLVAAAAMFLAIGAWAGAASQHSGVRFGSLLTAGLNVVPPGLFLLGLGALVLGAWPRRTAAWLSNSWSGSIWVVDIRPPRCPQKAIPRCTSSDNICVYECGLRPGTRTFFGDVNRVCYGLTGRRGRGAAPGGWGCGRPGCCRGGRPGSPRTP